MMMNLTNRNSEIELPLVIQLNKLGEKSIPNDLDYRNFFASSYSVYVYYERMQMLYKMNSWNCKSVLGLRWWKRVAFEGSAIFLSTLLPLSVPCWIPFHFGSYASNINWKVQRNKMNGKGTEAVQQGRSWRLIGRLVNWTFRQTNFLSILNIRIKIKIMKQELWR